MSSGIGVLQTQLHTLPIVCPTWGRVGLPAPLWDQFWHVLTVMVSLKNLFVATLEGELYEIIPATLRLSPFSHHAFSLQLATPGRDSCRTVPLRWSWSKRWPNWDSRHHSAGMACAFKKGLQRWSLHSRHLNLSSKENRLRMMLWMGLKPDGSSHTKDQFCLEFR